MELALILPLLLLLLFGIMEFGRIFAGYLELQHAARDGTRYAAIHHTDISEADIKDYVKKRLVMLNPSKLDFSDFNIDDPTADSVYLELNYPLEIVTPIISSLTGNIFNLQVRMVMKRE